MQEEAYWENLVKRSLCRFFLLAELARGPAHGYRINQAIQEACGGCCEPTEAMVYSTLKELTEPRAASGARCCPRSRRPP